MTIKNLLKTKVSFPAALLIIMTAALLSEQIFLEQIKADNMASNSLAITNSLYDRPYIASWQANIKEKVALANANIPLIPGAKRLTFDSKGTVRYRVSAPARVIAVFYRQILANQGWKTTVNASANAKLDKLNIAYWENSLSGKTEVTYSYIPVNTTKVLGVKIAEAEATAPAPAPEPAPAPAPAEQPASSPLPPADNNQTSSDSGQNQSAAPAPTRPIAPDNGYVQQPTHIEQPSVRPETNQMQFYKQPYSGGGGRGESQTCRVNGEEMPGSCEKYNNQGSAGQDGKMGQQGREGPSEEEQKKMDERRFKDMKRGLSQFTRGVSMMKKGFSRVKASVSKCGIGIPEELSNALSQADGLITKVNAAATADELDEISEDIQDVGSVMQDWGPRMGDLPRLCQMLKQAERDAKQFDRAIKRLESQAKANKKVDLSQLINEYKTAVAAQKEILAQAKELAKTDPDSALSKIEDDFYGNMDNLGSLEMQVSVVINISRGIKDLTRELRTFTSQIKALARKKVDTAELQELLNNFKSQVEDIKSSVSGKIDPEELIDKVEQAFDTRQNLRDALQELGMIKMVPQIKAGANFNVKVNIPDAFRKAENNNDDEE